MMVETMECSGRKEGVKRKSRVGYSDETRSLLCGLQPAPVTRSSETENEKWRNGLDAHARLQTSIDFLSVRVTVEMPRSTGGM